MPNYTRSLEDLARAGGKTASLGGMPGALRPLGIEVPALAELVRYPAIVAHREVEARQLLDEARASAERLLSSCGAACDVLVARLPEVRR